jgi:hypothetical protein
MARNTMKAYGGMDVQIHVFLTLALVKGQWLTLRPKALSPKERTHDTHWIGGWMGP